MCDNCDAYSTGQRCYRYWPGPNSAPGDGVPLWAVPLEWRWRRPVQGRDRWRTGSPAWWAAHGRLGPPSYASTLPSIKLRWQQLRLRELRTGDCAAPRNRQPTAYRCRFAAVAGPVRRWQSGVWTTEIAPR